MRAAPCPVLTTGGGSNRTWRNGCLNGQGTLVTAAGDKYEVTNVLCCVTVAGVGDVTASRGLRGDVMVT